jgi:hypothetical protein
MNRPKRHEAARTGGLVVRQVVALVRSRLSVEFGGAVDGGASKGARARALAFTDGETPRALKRRG